MRNSSSAASTRRDHTILTSILPGTTLIRGDNNNNSDQREKDNNQQEVHTCGPSTNRKYEVCASVDRDLTGEVVPPRFGVPDNSIKVDSRFYHGSVRSRAYVRTMASVYIYI